jgi:hypothetical protein
LPACHNYVKKGEEKAKAFSFFLKEKAKAFSSPSK